MVGLVVGFQVSVDPTVELKLSVYGVEVKDAHQTKRETNVVLLL
jgi:hypothetical protein